jgi:hypothetical protein
MKARPELLASVDEPFIKLNALATPDSPQKHSSETSHNTPRPAKRIRLVGFEPSDNDALRSESPLPELVYPMISGSSTNTDNP